MIVGLKIATREFPSLGNKPNELALNKSITKTSLFVHATSSINKLV